MSANNETQSEYIVRLRAMQSASETALAEAEEDRAAAEAEMTERALPTGIWNEWVDVLVGSANVNGNRGPSGAPSVDGQSFQEELNSAREYASSILTDEEDVEAVVEWVRSSAAVQILRQDVEGMKIVICEADEN